MNSSKMIISATITALLAMMALSQFGDNNGAQLFIGTGLSYDIVRGFLVFLLGLLLFVRPPRPRALRAVFAVTGLSLFIGVIYLMGIYQMYILDGLVLITIASVLGFEALEYDPHALELRDALDA